MTEVTGATPCICGHTRNVHTYGFLAGSACGETGMVGFWLKPCPCRRFTPAPTAPTQETTP